MKVIIIGANGKVGRRIAEKMSQSEHFEPTAFIRKVEQKIFFDSINVPVIIESLENTQDAIAESIKGFDAVVFSAGSGGATGYDKTIEIDLYGAIKAIHATAQSNIKRFIMVGAAFSDEPSYWTQPGMKPYYIAKHLADAELKRSRLDYTILRPVRLTDNEEVGKVKMVSDPYLLKKLIPRAAVAETVLQILDNSSTFGKVIEMSEGPSCINDAIKQLS
ncbi:SDR family oxidoreductase [Mangrovimonas cancribranchiae]|uniref:SDR family oxidoreductase n=1 Tax=Mangrovimonas cancribranchiae TaxID=3080055 RepID=A0AAU6NZ74_9FLAO